MRSFQYHRRQVCKNDNASTYLDGRMEIHGASGRQEFFSSNGSDCFELAEDAGTL